MPTVTIPTTTFTVGPHTVGPTTVAGTWHAATLTLDRTIAGGLDSLTAATTISFVIGLSTDSGVTWLPLATGGVAGGPPGDASPGIAIDFSPPLAAGQVRVTAAVAGTSVQVAGTLVVT